MQHPRPLSPPVQDAAPFSPEMVTGSSQYPARPSLPFVAKLGWSVSQTTHDPAPFGAEMTSGWHPDAPRKPFMAKLGWQVSQTTHDAAPFGAEMSAGWHPDAPRKPFVAKVGWSISQTTHDAAPFGPEMAAGWKPERPRIFIYYPQGQQLDQSPTPVPAPFGQDMITGAHPDLPRLPFSAKPGWSVSPIDIVAFPNDSVIGWHPDRPHLWIAFPQGQQLAQTTHVEAPFGPEMSAGSQPSAGRFFNISHLDYSITPPEVVAIIGSHQIILIEGRLAMQMSGMIYMYLD